MKAFLILINIRHNYWKVLQTHTLVKILICVQKEGTSPTSFV